MTADRFTYLGAGGDVSLRRISDINALAVAPSGDVYVGGNTGSTEFPVSENAYDSDFDGGGEAFVSRLSEDLGSLRASTFLGGGDNADDHPDIVLDLAWSEDGRRLYAVGTHQSDSFPTSPGEPDCVRGGSFVSVLDPDLTELIAGGCYGDKNTAVGIDLRPGDDGVETAYIAGTASGSPLVGMPDLPQTDDGLQPACAVDDVGYCRDGFVAAFRFGGAPPGDTLVAPLDIVPGRCPNELGPSGGRMLVVALVGSESFDVRWIDPGSVRLVGVKAKDVGRPRDVATPFDPSLGHR